MRYKSILTIAVFAMALFTACQKAAVQSNPDTANQVPAVTVTPTDTTTVTQTNSAPVAPKDDAPRISLEDAKKAYDKGGVLFIDTRAEAAYKTEHIKGAINIPVETIEARYKEIPKDKKVIAYCS